MALVKCKECGAEISNSAKTCPQCGAPVPKKTSTLTWIVGGFIALLFVGSISSHNKETTESANTVSDQSVPASIEQTTVPDQGWKYETDTDKMTGKESKYAKSMSINSQELHFPYQGGTQMMIILRKHPRMGTDAFISVNKGQMDTNYNGTTVSVKFDDKPPMKFTMNEPEDGSRDTLFFQNHKRFIENIKKSKHVIVETQFYQDGNRQFEFNTDGLKWE